MNKLVTNLYGLSGYLFLISFFSGRLKFIPVPLVASIFNLISLAGYLLGYLAWYLGALLDSSYPKKQTAWYGFAEFKEQYQLAALTGSIASILCILFPALIMPTAWIYVISNTFWSVGEYHKKQNPPTDSTYSDEKQKAYLRYALLITSASAIMAVAATVALFFPPIAWIFITSATLVGTVLTFGAMYHLIKSLKASDKHSSYQNITSNMPATSNKHDNTFQHGISHDLITSPASSHHTSNKTSTQSATVTHTDDAMPLTIITADDTPAASSLSL